MTISAVAGSAGPMRTSCPDRRRSRRRFHHSPAGAAVSAGNPPAGLAAQAGSFRDLADQDALPVSPPGVIGGAVIRAARRSAGLTLRGLARRVRLSATVAGSWENGTTPLFCLDYRQMRDLAGALALAGAAVGGFADLFLACQCDLLIAGMLEDYEDYAEVPPIDEDEEGKAARDLLRWALAGAVPQRYTPYATPGRLLAERDASLLQGIAADLAGGSGGSALISFGQALLDLTQP